jgi:hypothetical protein
MTNLRAMYYGIKIGHDFFRHIATSPINALICFLR